MRAGVANRFLCYKYQHAHDFIVKGKDEAEDDPGLVLKVHSLLAEGNPAVLAYAAKLGDDHVIREYLKNYPNEVRI